MCGLSFGEEEDEEELSACDDDEGRHNIWNDLLVYITENSALDCLSTEMHEFCHGP